MNSNFDFDRFSRTLVRDAPDAVLFVDRQGIIRFWNAGAGRIFGFSEAEAIGKSLDLIIPEDLRKRHWAGFHESIRTGITHFGNGNTLAVRAVRKDGGAIAVEFSMLPVRGDDGAILGIAAIMRDIRKRAGIIGAHPDWMNF